jgi:hypothetical protein
MDPTIPVLAGAVSTVIFACSTLPMLVKAAQTKDLSSYSFGNMRCRIRLGSPPDATGSVPSVLGRSPLGLITHMEAYAARFDPTRTGVRPRI